MIFSQQLQFTCLVPLFSPVSWLSVRLHFPRHKMSFCLAEANIYGNFWFCENFISYWNQNSQPCLLFIPSGIFRVFICGLFFFFSLLLLLNLVYDFVFSRGCASHVLFQHTQWCSHLSQFRTFLQKEEIAHCCYCCHWALHRCITNTIYTPYMNTFVYFFLNSGKVLLVSLRTEGKYITVMK